MRLSVNTRGARLDSAIALVFGSDAAVGESVGCGQPEVTSPFLPRREVPAFAPEA